MTERLYGLTPLRFIFALVVLFSHSGSFDLGDFYTYFGRYGYYGVSFFFVLSGYILAHSYPNITRNRHFYYRRIARVYPLYLVSIIVAFFIRIIVNSNYILDGIVNLPIHIFGIQSFVPIKGVYFGLNSPGWSISNELFFYAAFPFILKSHKNAFFLVFVGISSILFFDLINASIHYTFYINPTLRIIEFIYGIYLYKYARKLSAKKLMLFGAFILLFTAYTLRVNWQSELMNYWINLFLLIGYIINVIGKYGRPEIEPRWLRYLGEISFSFYLFHLPIIWLFEDFGLNSKLDFLVMIAITTFVSHLGYKFIELPSKEYVLKKILK